MPRGPSGIEFTRPPSYGNDMHSLLPADVESSLEGPPSYDEIMSSSLPEDHHTSNRPPTADYQAPSSFPADDRSFHPPRFSDYHIPKSYLIGEHRRIRPLVSIDQLKIHLALLRTFRNFRDKIEQSIIEERGRDIGIVFDGYRAEGTKAAVRNMSSDARWTWVVGLAVERLYHIAY